MREIICIHIGQAGVKIGEACWELFCTEHGIGRDGTIFDPSQKIEINNMEDSNPFECLFTESCNAKYVPRGLFIDTDPECIEAMKFGSHRHLHDNNLLLSGKESSSGIYSIGRYSNEGKGLFESSMDRIRLISEECSSLQGFLIFHSISGGSSGLCSNLLECLEDNNDFGKKSKLGFSIFPNTKKSSTSVVEPYNSVLSVHSLLESIQSDIILDNTSLQNIAQQKLFFETPSFGDLNQVISQVISSMTASLRYNGHLLCDITEFQTALVPHPRIKFILSSYSPWITPSNNTCNNWEYSLDEITLQSFESEYMLADCDQRNGKYMACCLLYRGDILPKDINSSVAKLKTKQHSVQFVDWSPTGFMTGISTKERLLKTTICNTTKSLTTFGNSTSIVDVFERLGNRFKILYSKKSFCHWFLKFGMEEKEFEEAKENIDQLILDYNEAGNDNNDDDDDDLEDFGESDDLEETEF